MHYYMVNAQYVCYKLCSPSLLLCKLLGVTFRLGEGLAHLQGSVKEQFVVQ